MTLARRSASVTPSRDRFAHRGFELRLQAIGNAFAFEIGDADLTLHASPAAFRSPFAAERAARLHIDDALGAFDTALDSLAA